MLEIIDAYNQLIFDIYHREGLVCLSDDQYTFRGENILSMSNPAVTEMVSTGLYDRLHEVTDMLKLPRFNHMYAENELIIASGDLKYRLGTLYLYYPFIVRLQDSYRWHRGKKHYVYEQTRNDARFNRELPIAFECLYKFWQRLSDYLLTFFPDGLLACRGKSFFHTFFEHIEKFYPQLVNSANYVWLKAFSQDEYPKFNRHRRFFVHNSGYDNRFFVEFLKAARENEDEMVRMDDERGEWLTYLKAQLELCAVGYVRAMKFVNELVFEKGEGAAAAFSYGLK